MRSFRGLPSIHLYAEPSTKTLDLNRIAVYLKELINVSVDVRPEFLTYHLERSGLEEVARELARIRVKDVNKPVSDKEPLYGEVEFEKRFIRKPEHKPLGVMYDGYLLSRIYEELLGENEVNFYEHIHIAFTNRLFGTFDTSDRRYHARVIICSFPSLISTTGIVEAPAKPREFYMALKVYPDSARSLAWERLKHEYRGRFIDYDDERMTEVMKGYVLQAIFYHLFQEPFCESKACRLYNAHWQEDVISAQLSEPEFCERHGRIISDLRRSSEISC